MKIRYIKIYALVLIWLIPIAFNHSFEAFFDEYWVVPFASNLAPSLFLDGVIICLLGIGVLQFIHSKISGFQIEWEGLLYSLLLVSYPLFYRLNLLGLNHWEFIPTVLWPKFFYVDFMIGIPIVLLIYKLVPDVLSTQNSLESEKRICFSRRCAY